jgi:Z1 domain-containing protein
MITDADLLLAVQLTVRMVSVDELPTTERIATSATRVLTMLRDGGQAKNVGLEDVIREVESRCNVFVPASTHLEDLRGHHEWLADRRGAIEWRFWERYRRYLADTEDLEPQALRSLDDTTNDVLRFNEDPGRSGPWDRRGMVVGQVQSGKTANYIGLICKAADAGYRLIVVLAGMHNSLRAQTQLRLDQGFLGFDTQRRMLDGRTEKMGVGAMPGAAIYPVHTLTDSSEKGDFKLAVAKQAHVMVGGTDPILLVVKKNKTILDNLIKWATFLAEQQDRDSGRSVVRGVPLLVIDDEADNASVDTGERPAADDPQADEYAPTAINGLIRRLLRSFEKSAYVGYTATPFANIFIFKDDNPDTNKRFGEDLFPRSFIVRLQPPSTYFGPLTVFGTVADPTIGIPESPGLPIVKTVDDQAVWIPDRHRSDWSVGALPASLKHALRSFILVCAARAARGHEREHNSMLVHVTRFTAVQSQVYDQVRDEVEFLQQRLRRGDGERSDSLLAELKSIWESDFVPTTSLIGGKDKTIKWKTIEPLLHAAAAKIEIRKINGTAKDALEYLEHPKGLTVIAIGGEKLSRGLTLEGLSVSYYLRAARMYDTLMQMGRWFGYRPDYQDLCRLYTTGELRGWYRDITLASEELLRLLDEMAAVGSTPEQFGLRVRTHPDGLMVTAAAKMRHGEKVLLSLAGTIPETLVFDTKSEVVQANFEAAEDFVEGLGEPDPGEAGQTRTWSGVDPSHVLNFVIRYRPDSQARKVQMEPLRRYIDSRVKAGELIEWTVALISTPDGRKYPIGSLEVGAARRKPDDGEALLEGRYVLRRMISPTDEAIDFSADERNVALKETITRWEANRGKSRRTEPPTVPSGIVLRDMRPAQKGLMLIYVLDPAQASLPEDTPVIGYALSFPGSSSAGAIEYVVNNVYYQQELALA